MQKELAELDTLVQTAIDVESGKVLIDGAVQKMGIAPTRFRSIAGLEVPQRTFRDTEQSNDARVRMQRIHVYAADRVQVESKLKSAGVEPLAILPVTAWEVICERAQLFRFTPNGDRVAVSDQIVEEALERATTAMVSSGNAFLWASAVALVIFTSLACATVTNLSFLPFDFASRNFIPVALGSLVVFCASVIHKLDTRALLVRKDNVMSSLERYHVLRLVKKAALSRNVHNLLWPNFHDRNLNAGLTIAISLPRPPENVQEILLKMERAQCVLQVAAVREAIGFKESPAKLLERWTLTRITEQVRMELVRIEEEKQRRSFLTQRDPIIYITHGSAVAIIAQFGDFPIEKKVMRDVVNSIHLV